jgi:hypothetical protein
MNQMTVVEGYIGNKVYGSDVLRQAGAIPPELMDLVTQNCAINRSCDVHFKVCMCSQHFIAMPATITLL